MVVHVTIVVIVVVLVSTVVVVVVWATAFATVSIKAAATSARYWSNRIRFLPALNGRLWPL